jgi:hypothetical protein
LYQVSNLGRVKSLAKSWVGGIDNNCIRTKDETILNQKTDKRGYKSVKLSKNGKRTYPKVHRLVLEAFVGKSNLQCNHKNGKTDENILENLEWVTAEENIKHGVEHGLFIHGENHLDAKLTEEQVRKIKLIAKTGKQKYGFWINLAMELNINKSILYKIRKDMLWKHVQV